MNSTPQIEIEIDCTKDEISFEIKGVPGTKCKDISKSMSSLMGLTNVEEEVTAEIHQHKLPDYIQQRLG